MAVRWIDQYHSTAGERKLVTALAEGGYDPGPYKRGRVRAELLYAGPGLAVARVGTDCASLTCRVSDDARRPEAAAVMEAGRALSGATSRVITRAAIRGMEGKATDESHVADILPAVDSARAAFADALAAL